MEEDTAVAWCSTQAKRKKSLQGQKKSGNDHLLVVSLGNEKKLSQPGILSLKFCSIKNGAGVATLYKHQESEKGISTQ